MVFDEDVMVADACTTSLSSRVGEGCGGSESVGSRNGLSIGDGAGKGTGTEGHEEDDRGDLEVLHFASLKEGLCLDRLEISWLFGFGELVKKGFDGDSGDLYSFLKEYSELVVDESWLSNQPVGMNSSEVLLLQGSGSNKPRWLLLRSLARDKFPQHIQQMTLLFFGFCEGRHVQLRLLQFNLVLRQSASLVGDQKGDDVRCG